MSRPKEWERIARDQHISLQSILRDIADETEQVLMNVGNRVYHNNKGVLAKQVLNIDRQVTSAIMLSQELQALIEDNDKSNKDWDLDFAKRQQDRANEHRRGQG